MTDEEFRLVRDLINEYCGIYFDDDARFLVERRLAPRLESLGVADFTEYHRHLRYSPDRKGEFEDIVERVTTNETYFFREQYQLDAFAQEILPAIHRARPRGRRLHLWSAGCATGEEAYTIAILILESGLFRGWEVRVFGNDVSRRVLAIARKGQYGKNSFRQTDDRYLRRYFRSVDGKQQIREEVKALVSFGQINLLEREMLAIVGEMDVVFCRNVLIYFDTASRVKVIEAFHSKLARGGYLLLGHTESLINLSTAFELVQLRNDMVYRKP
ncbi:MAG: protein-glutamate O-methyltransferase CheR [Myxococcales bacterium]|nr:protein-glutamate O-methyltransferase CheR [Myxococcales bacterium]